MSTLICRVFLVSWGIGCLLHGGVAESSCAAPRAFTGVESSVAYTYLYTPGYPHPNSRMGSPTTITEDFTGVFWSFGGGDPALGRGNDMGIFAPFAPTGTGGIYDAWIYSGGTFGTVFYPAMIYNPGGYAHWADLRIDNCIDLDGSNPTVFDEDQCMIIALSDQVAGVGYFALLSQEPNPNGDIYYFNRAAENQRTVLSVIPRPTILGTTRLGNDVQLDVGVDPPDPGEAVHLNCRAQQDFLIPTGYEIYYHLVPRGQTPPTERALESLVASGSAAPFDETVTLLVDCSEEQDQDVYLCAALTFESGFSTAVCSADSTAVQCGPTLGEPLERRRELRRFAQSPGPRP